MKVVPPPVLLGECCSIPHNQSPFYILFILISETDSLTAILTVAHEFKSGSYTPVPLILFHKVSKHPKSHNHQIKSVGLPGHLSPSVFQTIHVAHLQASLLVPPLGVLIEGWGSAQLVEMLLHQGHHMLQHLETTDWVVICEIHEHLVNNDTTHHSTLKKPQQFHSKLLKEKKCMCLWWEFLMFLRKPRQILYTHITNLIGKLWWSSCSHS